MLDGVSVGQVIWAPKRCFQQSAPQTLQRRYSGAYGKDGPFVLHNHRKESRISRRADWCIITILGTRMKKTIQVRISKGDRQFVAECLDLPVVTQAPTLDELFVNIREAVGLHLEGEDLASLGIASNPTVLATMELEAVA